MTRTKHATIRKVTYDYLKNIDKKNIPSPETIESEILAELEEVFAAENQNKPKNKQWKCPDKLMAAQIADILYALHPIISIAFAGEDTECLYDQLCIYQEDGADEGIYVADERYIEKLARQYNYGLCKREFNEIIDILKQNAPRKTRCSERNLIAVNNGIFDYESKQLLPFTPDKVFTSKSRVNYNPEAYNVVIHHDIDGSDWDVESWMAELFDDPEITQLMWEIIGAIIRPNVPWNKFACFYSDTGSNGKGSLCELMRQICGGGTHTAIPLSEFGKDFMLEPLVRASAIIVDENDVGTYIDKAANLKAVITGDVIQMNRKFKSPIAFQFKGFMVQCLNEYPRIRDKSDSFYRRQLFVPFAHCYTGVERKYIKHDYLQRTEVLEYVLFKVLQMNYYSLSTPKACAEALEEYKVFNDPIRQFMEEMMGEFVWDLLPFSFLYAVYTAWYKKNVGGEKNTSRKVFTTELLALLKNYPDWKCDGRTHSYRPGSKMDKPEPLIDEFNLKDWMNPQYRSSVYINKKCIPVLKSTYNGIVRA